MEGSGWRRADRRAVSSHLLFPPALAPPPRRDITGRQICQVLAALAESWRRPGEVITTSPPPPRRLHHKRRKVLCQAEIQFCRLIGQRPQTDGGEEGGSQLERGTEGEMDVFI